MALKGKRVLFISYNGMLDPLGQSQVIPYLRELSDRGVRFTLLSFEREAAFKPEGRSRCEDLRESLAREDIEWHWLRYHQKPSLPATIYDVLSGIHYGKWLVRRNAIDMIHARSHIPATIALALKRRFPLKMIFDVRGLMAEEYVDAGHWVKGGIPYCLTKTIERRALAASDGVITLTEKIWPIFKEWDGLRNHEVVHEVIPCCADLELFKFRPEDRARRRAELGLQEELVIVYSGSIGGWYLTEQMADFFTAVLQERANAHFLWLTPTNHDRIKNLMKERHVAESNFTVLAVATSEVPSYLSAADAGLALIKPCFSKQASSPTKNGEYLACGLPLIMNAGIGDSDTLIGGEKVGAIVSSLDGPGYKRALATIEGFVSDPEGTRAHTREVAERLFAVSHVGVERYARLYEGVMPPP